MSKTGSTWSFFSSVFCFFCGPASSLPRTLFAIIVDPPCNLVSTNLINENLLGDDCEALRYMLHTTKRIDNEIVLEVNHICPTKHNLHGVMKASILEPPPDSFLSLVTDM